MGLRKLPYRSLQDLLRRVPPAKEDAETIDLIRQLAHVKTDKQMSRDEFLAACAWKSPRSARHCRRNASPTIRRTIQKVFSTRDDRTRAELLISLHGVALPTASAVLTLTHPGRFGVLDIRVWQLLHTLGAVNRRPNGLNFSLNDWTDYLEILRREAGRLGLPVRRVELTLFETHQNLQTGNLYSGKGGTVRNRRSRIASQRGQR